MGIGLATGDVGIRAGLSLIGDLAAHALPPLSRSAARSAPRSSIVSTETGAVSSNAASMRMPSSSARNCSSPSRASKGETGSEMNRCKRSAAKGVDPEVAINRPLAERNARPGEIMRAQPLWRDERSNDLGRVGRVLFFWHRGRRQSADVDGRIVEQRERSGERSCWQKGQIALEIDDRLKAPLRIDRGERFAKTIGATGVPSHRERRFDPHSPHQRDDFRRIGRDMHGAYSRLETARDDMRNQRLSGEREQGLVRAALGREPCGNEDDGPQAGTRRSRPGSIGLPVFADPSALFVPVKCSMPSLSRPRSSGTCGRRRGRARRRDRALFRRRIWPRSRQETEARPDTDIRRRRRFRYARRVRWFS